jgi:nucleotide-binding universal stress UspA family protein
MRILHPTDLSETSHLAFAHALRLAAAAHAELCLLHVNRKGSTAWSEFPGVRATLVTWGMGPDQNHEELLKGLRMSVRKVVARHPDPVSAVLHFLHEHETDLIVLATHRHGGHMHWLGRSVAEPIAQSADAATLFVPADAGGFVSEADGSVHLDRVLIPVDHEPDPRPAVQAAIRLVRSLEPRAVEFSLLHVGKRDGIPQLPIESRAGWRWRELAAEGDVVDAIGVAATRGEADLIVMPTAGRHGFLDALRGSTTERVLHAAPCPLLAVPAWGERLTAAVGAGGMESVAPELPPPLPVRVIPAVAGPAL